MRNRKVTRRSLGTLVALAWTQPAAPATLPESIQELGLPADLASELEQRAEAVRREARWLADLPLEPVDPSFLFIPR